MEFAPPPSNCRQQVANGNDVEGEEAVDGGDAEGEEDQEVTQITSDAELKAIAKIMCVECLRASVQTDLFVDIIKEFGVANDEAM